MGNDQSELSTQSSETWKVKESITKMGYGRVNVRSEPSFDAPIVGTMDAGTLFNVYEKDGNWLRCSDGWTSRVTQDGNELSKYKHYNKSELEQHNDMLAEKRYEQEKRDNEPVEVRCKGNSIYGGQCGNTVTIKRKHYEENGGSYHCGCN
jgi:uncharacterized protein YgiM (DUF1202 family)